MKRLQLQIGLILLSTLASAAFAGRNYIRYLGEPPSPSAPLTEVWRYPDPSYNLVSGLVRSFGIYLDSGVYLPKGNWVVGLSASPNADTGLIDWNTGTSADAAFGLDRAIVDIGGVPTPKILGEVLGLAPGGSGLPDFFGVSAAPAIFAGYWNGYPPAYQPGAGSIPLYADLPMGSLPNSAPVIWNGMAFVTTRGNLSSSDGSLLGFKAASLGPGPVVKPGDYSGAASFSSPPAFTYVITANDATGASVAVEAAVLGGNRVPRFGSTVPSARCWLAPLSIVVTLPTDWNGNLNGLVVRDSAGTVIPPANYACQRSGNRIRITFLSFFLFSGPPAFSYDASTGLSVAYNSGAGGPQTGLTFDGGNAFSLSGAYDMGNLGMARPVVDGGIAYLPTEAVQPAAFTTAQYGRVAALGLGDPSQPLPFTPQWYFYGERRGDPADPVTGSPLPGFIGNASGLNYYSSFSFSPVLSGGTVYAGANYDFSLAEGSDQAGAAYGAVLYAVRQQERNFAFLPSAPDVAAPAGQSADPNQPVASEVPGVAFWVSSSLVDNSPQYSIPSRAGLTFNWRVDYTGGRLYLGPETYGLYAGRQLRVRYFHNGVLQDLPNLAGPVVVNVPDACRWKAFFPLTNQDGGLYYEDGITRVNAGGDPTKTWQPRIATPVVVASGTAYVGVLYARLDGGGTQGWIYAFRDDLPDGTAINAATQALWRERLGWGVTGITLARGSDATGFPLLVGVNQGTNGGLVAMGNPTTVIADNYRVIRTDQSGTLLTSAVATDASSRPDLSFKRPWKARHLVNGNLLVCDSDRGRVVEMNSTFGLAWEYTGPAGAPLSGPTDARSYFGPVAGVDCEAILIADPGSLRVLEVVRRTSDGAVVAENVLLGPGQPINWAGLTLRPPARLAVGLAERIAPVSGQNLTGRLRIALAANPSLANIGAQSGIAEALLSMLEFDLGYSGAAAVSSRAAVAQRGGTFLNVFQPRAGRQYDFLRITDMQQISLPQHDGTSFQPHPFAMVVDADGVKLIDENTWNVPVSWSGSAPTRAAPVALTAGQNLTASFAAASLPREIRVCWSGDSNNAAKLQYSPDGISWSDLLAFDPALPAAVARWDRAILPDGIAVLRFRVLAGTGGVNLYELTAQNAFEYNNADYAANMLGIADGINDPYKANKSFRPLSAKLLASGRVLIVNGGGSPYEAFAYAATSPLTPGGYEAGARTKSEVIEVDPLERVAQQMVRTDGNYFIVPDPFVGAYPGLEMSSYNLKQPTFADRY